MPTNLDIIVDDGLHTAKAAIGLFTGLYKNLRPGGVYIIEDVAVNGSLGDKFYDGITRYFEENLINYQEVSFKESRSAARLIVLQKPFE